MAVLNLSNMFVRQNQNSFGVGGLKGQGLFQQSGPINDMLNRISENMLSAKEQQAEFDSLVTTMTLDAAEQTESPLEDIPDEVLEIYLQVCKVGAHLAATRETSLIEYRSQLSAFDQTIEEYQQMLDGETAIPEDLTEEKVQQLLAAAQDARKTFLTKGADELNKSYTDPLQGNYGKVAGWIDGSGYEDLANTSWAIDADAKDIYEEIDRVLSATHNLGQIFRKGASAIVSELERRGYAEEPYKLHFERQQDAVADYMQDQNRVSVFQDIYDDILKTFSRSIL